MRRERAIASHALDPRAPPPSTRETQAVKRKEHELSISIGGGIPPHLATSAALQAGLTPALRNGARLKTASDPDGDGDNDHGKIERAGEASPPATSSAAGAIGRGLLVDTTA